MSFGHQDDGPGDAHELQSFLTDGDTHRRVSARPSSRDLKSGVRRSEERDDGSSDYDEEFAEETFRLRMRNSYSLDLPGRVALGADESDEENLRAQDTSKSSRAVPDTDDPSSIISRVIPETDDPSLPALTFRAVLMGSLFAAVGSGLSQLFFYKSNSPSFSSYFVILVSLPMGRWMARIFPKRKVKLGLLSFDLNPGPFNIKEHLLCAVIASCGAVSAYASDIINVQSLFYGQEMGIVSSLTLLITSQTIGFSFAGLMHDLLVKPISMIFPSTLVTATMFTTLHDKTSADMKPRLRFFSVAFLAIFGYQFLPALFMPTLSSLALLCFIDNTKKSFRVLSSGYKGFGFLNISLDWNAMSTSGPLYQPWWAALNFFAGLGGAMYVVMPLLYYFNFWNAQSFPSAIDAKLYQSTSFTKFNVSSVLKPDHTLDWERWEERKPILLTPWFAISYALSFAILTSMIAHVLLWHRNDIYTALRRPVHDDIHNRLMRASYADVPKRWYIYTFTASLSSAVFLVASTPLQLPVWGLLLAVSMALIFLIPAGVIKAVSDTSIGLNVITEFVAGILMPGKPIANIVFKSMSQALDLTTDLKLAHYMKIPPRSMFIAQVLGTIIGCIVNLAVVRLVLSPNAGYRVFLDGTKVDPTGQWDGRKVGIFYSASIIWGAIGPIEFFSGKYRTLFWGFAIGALAPLIPFLLNKYWPRKYWSKVHFPVMFHGAAMPPMVPTNVIMSGFFVAWLSQWWARTHRPKWFVRFNYLLAAALDSGASINALCIFILSITLLKWSPLPHWFMNPEDDSEHCTPVS